MGAELFVIVQGDPTVWRLVEYNDRALHLAAPGKLDTWAQKELCRVGEAKDWFTSRHAPAWEAGGGEALARSLR